MVIATGQRKKRCLMKPFARAYDAHDIASRQIDSSDDFEETLGVPHGRSHLAAQHIARIGRLGTLERPPISRKDEFDQEKRRLVSGQGTTVKASADPAMIPAHGLLWAVMATFFCSLPFGVVAFVKAALQHLLSSLWASGQYEIAYAAAEASRRPEATDAPVERVRARRRTAAHTPATHRSRDRGVRG